MEALFCLNMNDGWIIILLHVILIRFIIEKPKLTILSKHL